MRRIAFCLLCFCLLFTSCEKSSELLPTDADDNFITSVVLTVHGTRYAALILDNTITLSVPDTVSLSKATADVKYTRSASVVPKPETIDNWENELTFRVTSQSGKAREYSYRVVKGEMTSVGSIELKSNADVAEFAKTKTTSVKGNLIIGMDADAVEKVTDITPLSILTEVTGTIVIRRSFTGSDLTGLENIKNAGGLQIGNPISSFDSKKLELVSMPALESISGDIMVCANTVKTLLFEKLTKVKGSVICSSSALSGVDFPSLDVVQGDFIVQTPSDEKQHNGDFELLKLPNLTEIGGTLIAGSIETLRGIQLPRLKKANAIQFNNLPEGFSRLDMPSLEEVTRELHIGGRETTKDNGYSYVYNTTLKSIDVGNLKRVGSLTMEYFQELEIPSSFFSSLIQIGQLTLNVMLKLNSTLDLSNTDFVSVQGESARISIDKTATRRYRTPLNELRTKSEMSNVDFFMNTLSPIKFNFTTVGNLVFYGTWAEEPISIPSLVKVEGNLFIQSGDNILLPNIKEVGGYFFLNYAELEGVEEVAFPNLERVGGQLFLDLSNETEVRKVNLEKINAVGVSSDVAYYTREVHGTQYGSLGIHFNKNGTVNLPSIETIGGAGLSLRRIDEVNAPELRNIDSCIYLYSGKITPSLLNIPKLEVLRGFYASSLRDFNDFEKLSKFIKSGQIESKEKWSISECGYNPTFDNMKKGLYTKELYDDYKAKNPNYKD